MSVNVPLLRKYVEWVEEQERLTEGREWLQEYWVTDFTHPSTAGLVDEAPFCDTAFCLAGKIAVDHGWKPVWHQGASYKVRRGGQINSIPQVAADLLGIPYGDGLFDASNTAADIRRIAEDIAGERL